MPASACSFAGVAPCPTQRTFRPCWLTLQSVLRLIERYCRSHSFRNGVTLVLPGASDKMPATYRGANTACCNTESNEGTMNRAFVYSAMALLTPLPALAQQAPIGGMPGQPQVLSDPSTQGPGSYPHATASPQQVGDQEFVSRALQGEDAEIELSQLAQQKSQSEDVKQFARKMVLDHSQMSDKWFKPLAKQLGVSEPNGISRKDKKLIARLETFSGNDFETEYIKAMVKDHKDDLRDFQSEAQMTLNPNVKRVAQQGQTVISEHLLLIEQVAKNHNVPVEDKILGTK
jgi:putative membrane protein